jgi:hypothetical protein
VYQFLGSNLETNNETAFVARHKILISKKRLPLLGNGLVKLVPAATDTHATMEVLLETVFSTVVGAEAL